MSGLLGQPVLGVVGEQLDHEVREDWTRRPTHLNSPFETGMLAVAQRVIDDVLGLDADDAEWVALHQRRNDERLLWVVTKSEPEIPHA